MKTMRKITALLLMGFTLMACSQKKEAVEKKKPKKRGISLEGYTIVHYDSLPKNYIVKAKDYEIFEPTDGSGWPIKINTRFHIGRELETILEASYGSAGPNIYMRYSAGMRIGELFDAKEVIDTLHKRIEVYRNGSLEEKTRIYLKSARISERSWLVDDLEKKLDSLLKLEQ